MKQKRELRSSTLTITPNTDTSGILASSKQINSALDDSDTTTKAKGRGRPKKTEVLPEKGYGKVSEFCLETPENGELVTPIAHDIAINPEEPSL